MVFTPFQISTLITAFVSLFLGISIYSRERKSKLNFSWFLSSLSISFWSIGLFGVVFSSNQQSAWFWQYVLDVSAILIPSLFLNFILVLIGKEKKFIVLRILSFVLSGIIVAISFTDLFKVNVSPKFDLNFWIDPGKLYFLFPLIFALFVAISFFFTIKECLITQDRVLKRQLQYIFLAQVIGWGGGMTNFFPQLFKVYPFGNYLVALYVIFISYAALKHHLFDVKIIATELLTFAVWTFLAVKFALSNTLDEFILNGCLLIFIVILGVLLIRSILKEVKQREKLEELSERIKKAYEIEKAAREQSEKAYEIEKRAGIAKERALELEKKALEKEKEVHQELNRLDKAKNQFMLATQHHLRTPLTSMRGYLDLIFGGTYGKIPPKLKEVLKRFEISTKNEVKLVNEFLDVSQFQLGKGVVILRDGVEVQKIVKEAVSDVEIEAKSKGIYVKAEIPKDIPQIKADEFKLKAAIYNIVDNAVKYTKEGGVTISLEKKDDKLRILIKDTGMGISKEEIGKLFGKLFERGEQAEKIFSTGRGIGLYITFKIVEAHNGRIWAESEGVGKGTTFIIELPITQIV